MTKSRVSTFFAALVANVFVLVGAGSAQAAETFTIDSKHAFAVFKVKHLGVANAWGRFNKITGTVKFDEDKPELSSINIEIDANSVDTGVAKRDAHLRDTDFFSAKEFPVITFTSKKIEPAGDDVYRVTGDLFLHGVTKEITVNVTHTGTLEEDPWGMKRIGGETQFNLDRTEHGMNWRPSQVGTDVTIYVSFEATHK